MVLKFYDKAIIQRIKVAKKNTTQEKKLDRLSKCKSMKAWRQADLNFCAKYEKLLRASSAVFILSRRGVHDTKEISSLGFAN